MSKYTTEVRYLCEFKAGLTESAGYHSIQQILETSAPLIFDFDFPIFDENYRLPLEIKILKHYYTREISEETVGLWKLRLDDRLNMIMPYYNKLYESELLKFNPFYDVDVTRIHSRENENNEINSNVANESINENGAKTRTLDSEDNSLYENENNAQSNNTSESATSDSETHWELYSDTPQGGVVGINNATDSIAANTYLTNATKNTDEAESGTESTSNNTSNTIENGSNINTKELNENELQNNVTERSGARDGIKNLTSIEDYAEQVIGKQGADSYSKMLQEFRKTFLNIDKMIIDELSDLFFGLWG